jgi:predicted nucleic acid-binding protein
MILVDTNVLLDVIQKREPFYRTSAAVLDHVIRLRCRGFLPTHAVTTIHYLVDRYQDAKTANQAVAWLLSHFDIAGITRAELVTAQSYGWKDYEDAVVAAAAKTQGCRHIVSRPALEQSSNRHVAVEQLPREHRHHRLLCLLRFGSAFLDNSEAVGQRIWGRAAGSVKNVWTARK